MFGIYCEVFYFGNIDVVCCLGVVCEFEDCMDWFVCDDFLVVVVVFDVELFVILYVCVVVIL